MTATGRELIDVLERITDVEWFRYTRLSQNNVVSIPVTSWRFGDATNDEAAKDVITLLSNVISTPTSGVTWVLFQRGRNWVLVPEQVYNLEESGAFKTDGEVLEFLNKKEPSLASKAHIDLLRIAAELEEKHPSH